VTKLEYGIIAAIVVALVLMVVGAMELSEEKQAFMAECIQDRKGYECEAMWKQMHPDPQHVVVTGFVSR